MPTLPGLSQPCTVGFPVIHVRDAWSICGVFGATAFFRVWRFTHARSTTQTTLPRLPCGQLDALTSPYSGHQKTIGLAGLSSTGFTEVPGLTSLSRTVGNGFAFKPQEDVVGRPPSRAMDTNGEARCLQFERLLDPRMLHSSCPGRTARTKSPARVDQSPGRRPLLLCPAAFEVSPSLTAGLGLDPTLGRLMCVERTASPVPPRYEVFLARFGHPSSGSGSTWS